MFKDIIIIAQKEFAEQKRTIVKLLPMSILILLPLVLVATNSGTLGNPLVSQHIVVSIFPNLLGGGICYELIKNNILLERKSKMLDILLISDISKIGIVIGKVFPGVIVGSCISYAGSLILAWNVDYRVYFNIGGIITVPWVLYLFNVLNLILSLMMKDEKVASVVSILIMVLFCIPISMANTVWFSLLTVIIFDIFVTLISAKLKWIL